MTRNSVLAATILLIASETFAQPLIIASSAGEGIGALSVVTDEAAAMLQVEVSVVWGGSPSNSNPLRIVDVAQTPGTDWTSFTTYNPLIGADTSGIYFPEGATHFFASFQTTDVAAGATLPLLDLGMAGQYGSMGLASVIRIDGTSYNFTNEIGHPEPPPSFGDMEPDGDVDINDFGIFADSFGSTVGSPRYNLNSDAEPDGDVDIIDFGWFADNYGLGSAASVPEPTALLLAAVATLGASVGQRN